MGIKTVKEIICDHCKLEILPNINAFYTANHALIFHLNCLHSMSVGQIIGYLFDGDIHKIIGTFDSNGDWIRSSISKELLNEPAF